MELPFLTLPKYDGRTLNISSARAVLGGGHAHQWDEDVPEDDFENVFRKVRDILAAKGETVEAVARLGYDDVKGFGNKMFRIQTTGKAYFLKILGDAKGNRREVFVWKVLGYGEDGKRHGSGWLPGLPPEVYPLESLSSVLTRFYPGQLKALPGEAYEFPMVLALVINLSETLAGFHQQGLVYMDLCPANILFLDQGPQKPVLFFLTDMGSVKLAAGGDGEESLLRTLGMHVTAQRLTRAETQPPAELFPRLPGGDIHETPGYDFHTLMRTAYILLGMGSGEKPDPNIAACFGDNLDLEKPLEPRRFELEDAVAILEAARDGSPIDKERLTRCFKAYFLDRAAFVGDYIDEPLLKKHWVDLLLSRLARYKTVLAQADRRGFEAEVAAIADRRGEGGLGVELALLRELPLKLKSRDMSGAANAFREVAGSRLLKVSPTARYSYLFHKKLLKTLGRGNAEVESFFQSDRSDRGGWLEQIPERETIDALRRGRSHSFGILTRTFAAAE